MQTYSPRNQKAEAGKWVQGQRGLQHSEAHLKREALFKWLNQNPVIHCNTLRNTSWERIKK